MRKTLWCLVFLCLTATSALSEEGKSVWRVTAAHPTQIGSPEDFEAIIRFQEEVKGRIEAALKTHANIAAVREMAGFFKKGIQPTFFVADGQSAMSSFLSLPDQSRDPSSWGMEVVIYGSSVLNHPMIQRRLLFYHQPWQAVVSAGLEWGDPRWFDALMIHELYHAHQDGIGAEGSRTRSEDDTWVREEVAGHTIESLVLNASTGGEYHKHLEATLDAFPGLTPEALAVAVTSRDFERVNAVFKAGSEEEMALRNGQYYLDLAFKWVERTFPLVEWDRQRIEAYRAVVHAAHAGTLGRGRQ